MAQNVSMTKYQAVVAAKDRALARANAVKAGASAVGVRAVAGNLFGAAAAGVVDGYMTEGTATSVGLVTGTAGLFLRSPDLVNAATGMLAPSVYRMSRKKAEEMKAQRAAVPPSSTSGV